MTFFKFISVDDDFESPLFMPQTSNFDSAKPKTDKLKNQDVEDDDVKDSWDKGLNQFQFIIFT